MPSSEKLRILLIDDEKVIRDGCERALASENYEIHHAENGNKGIDQLKEDVFDIVLLDLMMPGMDGFSVLKWIKSNQPWVMVIVITGFATVAKAVEAMKQGAFNFVSKPFTPDLIRLVVSQTAEQRLLVSETAKLREESHLDHATIAKEQSRLNSIFSCMEGAVMVTDHLGTVVLHNPAAIRMLEVQTDPVIGKPLSDSILDQGAQQMVSEAIYKGSSVTREFPPGTISRLFLRARCAPVRVDDGKTIGSVTVFEDITTHKKIDQHKSEFVAMVAHDLRAPLAAIVQMIYAIQMCAAEDNERRTHLLNRISVRIKDQLQMIENLLSLSRLETGSLVLNLEPINGNEILSQVVETIQPKAESKEIELKFEPTQEPWRVSVDLDQMQVVLTNIVDNAIKYTNNGGRVTVSASVNNSLGRISIADNGIGIATKDLKNIFDRFFRVKGKDTRGITGSGLGLSLVQKVIEAHNGSIDVESEPGRGTTFIVNLPIAEASS
ncbi:MAG: response regulator [Deltaproteobacteria bacterium]|nr:response regulator [Deltaproteobacteria bacterium]